MWWSPPPHQQQQQPVSASQDNAALRMTELGKKEHRLTFAGEKDAHRLFEFLKEKETTLHTYVLAGKLDWSKPADRIVVLDWLGLALTGNARTWWDSVTYHEEPGTGIVQQRRLWESFMDWEQVKAAFKGRWERTLDVAAAHRRFHTVLAQKPGEPLYEFNARFDMAAEGAQQSDPGSLATRYFYALQESVQDKMILHVLSTKGQAEADKVPFLSLKEKRELAEQALAVDAMLNAKLGRYRPAASPQATPLSRGGLHSMSGGGAQPQEGDWDQGGDEGVDQQSEEDTWLDDSGITGGGAIHMLNSNGGRNNFSGARSSYNGSALGNTVHMSRAGAVNKKRKAGGEAAGRTRHPSAASSPAASRGGTPRHSSPAGKPPPYRGSSPSSGGARGMSPADLSKATTMRERWGACLSDVADAVIVTRMQQQLCVLCGGKGHMLQQCPNKGGQQRGGVKKEHPKGTARGDRQ
jgi:hypothetical protein